jgi:non-homologous end joining protein Ku
LHVDAAHNTLATKLLKSMTQTAFDYDAYPDGYGARVREVVQRKADAPAFVTPEEPKLAADLMSALVASLGKAAWEATIAQVIEMGTHNNIQRIADALEQTVEILEHLVKAQGGEEG